jgi:hypothetical protein
MTARLFTLALLAAGYSFAADEEPAKRTTAKEAMRAKLIEDAKKQPAKPSPAAAAPTKAAPSTPASTPPATKGTAPTTAQKPAESNAEVTTPVDPTTVLPKIEVNRGKIHPLARELFEKEREIAREKELTKPTELDKALNNPKVSIPLFGGQSTASRASIASERTALLEAEADLIEEIGRARTKEQKAELRKQLDELKKVRRDLEHAIR